MLNKTDLTCPKCWVPVGCFAKGSLKGLLPANKMMSPTITANNLTPINSFLSIRLTH